MFWKFTLQACLPLASEFRHSFALCQLRKFPCLSNFSEADDSPDSWSECWPVAGKCWKFWSGTKELCYLGNRICSSSKSCLQQLMKHFSSLFVSFRKRIVCLQMACLAKDSTLALSIPRKVSPSANYFRQEIKLEAILFQNNISFEWNPLLEKRFSCCFSDPPYCSIESCFSFKLFLFEST